jgi:hypothetical protein
MRGVYSLNMNSVDLKSFNNNGFLIRENLIKDKYHSELFYLFYDLAVSIIKRNKIDLEYQVKNVEDIDYNRDIKILDKILLDILKIDNKLIGELYDTVSYSSSFLKLVSDSDIEEYARSLLGLSKRNTIYSWAHRVRIDPPKDERRTYGWHQEIFYTIPETKFIQTWCPIIRDTTIENGTIEVCEGSHKEGIAKQTWNEIEGRATQIIVNEEVVAKYKQKKVPMKKGEILFFDPHMFHRSGHNSTKDEVRFSLVGMWNDTTYHKFKAPRPEFKSRTFSAKDYFNQLQSGN